MGSTHAGGPVLARPRYKSQQTCPWLPATRTQTDIRGACAMGRTAGYSCFGHSRPAPIADGTSCQCRWRWFP
uniref:Uncharacterized protein n=1 Tax=uncultured marine virus TaxID=186617 RepID=A0A0F7L234_9VIRU|nr:hypothetical protein [uncultured marine virus]